MSNGHGSSRRQAYGRRMKDLRTRRGPQAPVDLDGPSGWTRGDAWDEEATLHRLSRSVDARRSDARPG